MAEINIVDEIMRHTDDEIISFLSKKASGIARTYDIAQKDEPRPEYLMLEDENVKLVRDVLRAMDRRNKERSLQ